LAVRAPENRVAIIESLRARLASVKEKAYGTAAVAQRAAVVAAGGFVLGKIAANYRADNAAVPTVMGIDWQLTWGVAGIFAGHFVGGRWGELLQDASSAALAVYAYEQAQR
jgi:hypothetical protein